MDRLRHDVRYALRQFRRSPGFAAVAVGTLALGIGATTAVFSVVEGVLLRPLPYPEPHELVRIFQINPADPSAAAGGAVIRANFSHPNFVDVRERTRTLEGMAEYSGGVQPVTTGTETERVRFAAVSGDFFEVLGVRPSRGRGFLPGERDGRGAPVAIISHGYWRRALGGTDDLASTTLHTPSRPYTVVGVLPPGFEFQNGTDVFVPQTLPSDPSRTAHSWGVLGRLREGATIEQARQDLGSIARRLAAEHGDDTWMVGADIVPLREDLVGDLRPAFLVLLGAAAFLLLIACANVASLLLSRLTARRRELAVRRALGAGGGRLARQLLTESVILALCAGAAGALLAHWGVDALLALDPGRLPRASGIGVNGTVLAFALAASLLTALAIGWIATLWSARGDVRDALSAGQRTQAGARGAGRVQDALVAAQVALTLVLLAGAGLLGRSFQRLLAVDPGYRTEEAVVMDLSLPYVEDEVDAARLSSFLADLRRRLRAVPGVETVGGVDAFPLSGGGPNGTFLVLSDPREVGDFEDWRRLARDPGRTGYAEWRIAHADYFRAMDIPVLRGRGFEESDGPDAPHVALISESLARTRWPDEGPLGKLVHFGNMDGDLRAMRIVGVVGDIRERSLAGDPRPTLYGNARQRTGALGGPFSVVVRGLAGPAAAIAAARRVVRELDPTVPVRFRTLESVLSDSLADRRFSLSLLGIFGLTALLVAAAGLYGLISFRVTRRTQEVGVRMALGARTGDVLRLVVGRGAALAGIGIACGLLAAFGLTRFLSGLLYDVAPVDPATFAGIAVLLAAVAMLASYLPARRAAGVEPAVTLRAE